MTLLSITLEVGKVLFKPYRGLLVKNSEVLRNMFTMPQDEASPSPLREGRSDENPIRLEPGIITEREFEHILFFIFGARCVFPFLLL